MTDQQSALLSDTIVLTIDPASYPLTISISGSGQVTSSPAGIDCGPGDTPDCDETLDHGTQVVLSATPASGSTFTGWIGGGCPAGEGAATSCTIVLDQALAVSASFTREYRSFIPLLTRP